MVVVLAVLAIVVWLVMSPLRRSGQGIEPGADREALEAAKEAKYAEIREAEMDYRTGKLSEADWRALDRTLRGEAIELLDRLERLE